MGTPADIDHHREDDLRRPTMRDVAESIGVSRQLVSLVMRDAPGPSARSRARVLQAADALGYRRNVSAQLLRQRRTHLLGVLFSLRNPFEVRFVEELEERAAGAGFGLVLGAHGPGRPTDPIIARFTEQRVEGVLAFNPDPRQPAFEDALRHVPVVWLGERAGVDTADNVRVDELSGLRLAVQHLRTLGHEAIAYVGGGGGTVGRDRADAYRTVMRDEGLLEHTEVIDAGFSEEDGADAARSILGRSVRDRPTAVVCCGDLNATGLLAVLARADVVVPGDLSVVGFDDSYVAALSYHRLTSIRQDVEQTVDAALTSVLRRLSDSSARPQEVLTPTTLVTRASTGPARA